jgi:hypothetical protein
MLIPYLNSLTNTTTDSDSLINLSKSSNILTLNYNNLVSRLNTYQTITAFNSSIALKADKSTTYTKTEVDSAIALSQSQIGTQITTTLIPYVNTLSVTTTDSNSLINLTKSNNTLTFNYDNLISRLSTFQTTTSYNSSIANYFTKTQINTTLGSYVNTVSNTTNDNLSLISLTKVNNVLTLNYNNLASKFGGYYSTAEIDLKLGQKVDNFTIGVGLNFLTSGGSTDDNYSGHYCHRCFDRQRQPK